jgi:16S rRNA processing protein RimM
MKYLLVGKIIGTHGIKGEVKVKTDSGFKEDRYRKGSVLYAKVDGKMEQIIVDSHREHKNLDLIKFNNYQNINEVLKYISSDIFVNRDSLVDLEEDEYYYDDLIGMSVYNQEKQKIGIVEDINEVPQGEILVIRKENGKKALVPFINEFVSKVNLEEDFIVIIPIEGLL